jgi:hypothetical protein
MFVRTCSSYFTLKKKKFKKRVLLLKSKFTYQAHMAQTYGSIPTKMTKTLIEESWAKDGCTIVQHVPVFGRSPIACN